MITSTNLTTKNWRTAKTFSANKFSTIHNSNKFFSEPPSRAFHQTLRALKSQTEDSTLNFPVRFGTKTKIAELLQDLRKKAEARTEKRKLARKARSVSEKAAAIIYRRTEGAKRIRKAYVNLPEGKWSKQRSAAKAYAKKKALALLAKAEQGLK